MPPKQRSTLREVTQNTAKQEEERSTLATTAKTRNRKEYYLITTLLYLPKYLITRRDKGNILETECLPQLFSSEQKAKDYMRERAEELKSILLKEGSYFVAEDREDGSIPHVDEKVLLPEDITTHEFRDEQIILGFKETVPLLADDYWAFIKLHAILLNGTLPPVVAGTGKKKGRNKASSSTSSSNENKP